MSNELDELAERGRATRQAREGERRAARRRSKLTSEMLTSLRPPYVGLLVGLWCLVSATPIVVFALGSGARPVQVGALYLGASFLLASIGTIVILFGTVRRELAWLRAIPYRFDPDAYLSLLGRYGNRARLVVRVGFASPLPEHVRQTVADAVIGATGAERASFDGDQLVVVSPEAQVYFSPNDDERYYSNRALHRFFRRLVNDALEVVHRSHPVEAVEPSTEGHRR